jgi:hypothetical protein
MKNSTRDAILQKLKVKSADKVTFSMPDPIRAIPREELIARFTDAAEKLNATILKCHLPDISEILKDYQPLGKRVLSPELQRLYPTISGTAFSPAFSPKELSAFSFGISAPQYGLAQTGSIVEFYHFPKEQLISLIPETHIAILNAESILADHHQLFPLIPNGINLTLISGASRTADIEKRIVIGAHGPKKLIIILVFP